MEKRTGIPENKEVLHQSKVINLLEIFRESGSPEKAQLEEAVKKSGGLIRIMVHPFFDRWKFENDDEWEEIYSGAKKIKVGLNNLIKNENTPPLLVFEENNKVTQKKSKNYFQNNSANPVYFLQTGEQDSTPLIKVGAKNLSENEAWNFIYDKLKQIGVKRVIAGGMLLDFIEYDQWEPGYITEEEMKKEMSTFFNQQKGIASKAQAKDKFWLGHCVGDVMAKMANGGFEVDQSTLTSSAFGKDFIDSNRRSFIKLAKE